MNRTLTAAALVACAALTACSSNNGSSSSTAAQPKAAASKQTLTASTAMTQIAAKVPTAKQSGTVTATSDPDHLLGRPHQYTSKVTLTDTRIKASDVEGTSKGDVSRGGEIEVFGSPADAAARAKYIETVTKAMPALTEYDYVHGTVLVRVSQYMTPAQAGEYKAAAANLG